MRVVKEHDERRNEILEVSEKLFLAKGYNNTSIEDIIKKVNIAKGTFYYYFESKEKVMHEVVKRYVNFQLTIYSEIVKDKKLNAIEKFKKMLEINNQIRSNQRQIEMVNMVHSLDAEIHIFSMRESIAVMIPLIEKLIIQGNNEKNCSCPYPKTAAEIIIASLQILFDNDLIKSNSEEMFKRLFDFSQICEKILGSKKDSFSFIYSDIKGN